MIKKIPLTEIHSSMDQVVDLFICSASFEERCFSVAQRIDPTKIAQALILFNHECQEYMQANIEVLKLRLGQGATIVELLYSDPISTADKIRLSLEQVENRDSVKLIWLDITTFTHETLLIVLKLIGLVFPNIQIKCLYANAYEYNSENTTSSKWLSKGIQEIRSVLGYLGDLLPTQRTHLIIIVGYEHERAIGIINALEPASISLGFGRSDNATTQKDEDANELFKDLVRQTAKNYADIDCFEVMCNNPFSTAETIIKKIDSISGKNILIVPLNNKISTIGVALAAEKRENIQICYAPATIYNYLNYSNPGDSCYVFDFPNHPTITNEV